MTIIEKLERARDLIKGGWCQRAYEVRDGDHVSYCSLGAMMRAMGELGDEHWDDYTPMKKVLGDAIKEQGGGSNPFDFIVNWNDDPNRTKDEVIAAFDKAIENEKAKVPA